MLGTTISHYKLLDSLGAGGMGVVYRAEDTRLGRQVAFKCLPPDVAVSPQAVERFLREARSASALNHPNICTIYEVDEANGLHFIAMELLEGQTLRDRIAEGPIPGDEVVRIALEIAGALDAAHKKGIVHRDIKPGNVFLTESGQTKVLDFGLAKLDAPKLAHGAASLTAATAGADPLHLTSPGQAVGTIAYMSPEQARGQDVDARSDLFSVGVVLYEMATGRPAFPGSTSAVIFDAILNREPVRPSRLNPSAPLALDSIVARLLEKDFRLRYQTASDLIADLRRSARDAVSTASVSAAPAATSAKKRKAGKTIDSLAVLPFANSTGHADLDYLGDALAEGVIDALSRLPRLRVVPRGKAFRHRAQADDPQAAGHDLEVRAVLTGRITARGDTLLIRAEMIDVAKDAQLWGAQLSYSHGAIDVLAIQREIARGVTEKLAGPSSGGTRTASGARQPGAPTAQAPVMPAAPTVNKEAYQLFVRGTHHANKWTEEGLQLGIKLYRQAIDVDPLYAPAHAAMAIAQAISNVISRVDVQNSFRQARAYARRAIELNDALSEAHAALGITYMYCDFNLPDAVREGKRAVELDPASAVARYALAQSMACSGHVTESVESAREGCELDPLMGPINYCYGLLLYYSRRWTEAEAQLRRTLEINPSFQLAQGMLGIVLARAGRFTEAIAEAARFKKLNPDPIWDQLQGYVAALAGDREMALAAIAHNVSVLGPTAGYFASVTLGAIGEFDRGFAELERARELRFSLLVTAAVNPSFDPYRQDPRWTPFLRSLNLPT